MSELPSQESNQQIDKCASTLPKRSRTKLWPWLAMGAVLLGASYLLHSNGRPWWCACGIPILWSGDIQSLHNSQHLFDPYSFTHMLHGVIFYGLLAWSVPRLSMSWRLACAISLEAMWELLENSDLVIERYRTATISLGYQGDTIANSLGDILSCSVGFSLASHLGLAGSLILFAATELALVVWIRDSLVLSTLMLIHPMDAIKAWQQGS
jgi:hypothetical protein